MANKSTSNKGIDLPTVKDLLEAGAHFGHETKRWHPRYEQFIYTKRDKFHVIDLEKTLEKLNVALRFLKESAAKGDILIVGTKRQARGVVRDEAIRAGSHFVTNRWVGGTITNFERILKSINSLNDLERTLKGDIDEFSQQDLSNMRREWARLDRLFGGIKNMDSMPSAVIVIDAMYEKLAVRELIRAEIPIVALVDSNTNPDNIDYPIPANDDAIKSVELFVKYFADAILAGNKGRGIDHDFTDLSMVGIKQADLKLANEKNEDKEGKEEKLKNEAKPESEKSKESKRKTKTKKTKKTEKKSKKDAKKDSEKNKRTKKKKTKKKDSDEKKSEKKEKNSKTKKKTKK